MKVELLQDFGGKTKGTVINLPESLSASLIRKEVAKVYVAKPKKEVKPKEEK